MSDEDFKTYCDAEKTEQLEFIKAWLDANPKYLTKYPEGNTLKTLRDIGLAEPMQQKGEKRGKHADKLEDALLKMQTKERLYLCETPGSEEYQRLKNVWSNAQSKY